jgi:phosphate-selective porin OprO/OprP
MAKKQKFTSAALVALAAAGGIAVNTGIAQAQSAPTVQPMNGAPEIRDGEQRFKIRGRFQYDFYSNEWDAPGNAVDSEDGSRSYVRRAFIGAQGRLTDHWRYKVDFVLNPGASGASSGSNEGEVAVDDAYLEYAGDFYSIVIGENNVTAPLEDRTSSLDIPFLERSSYINAFGYGRAAGVAGLITGANWMAAVGVYGDSLNNREPNFSQDETTSVSGRFTWAPIFESTPDSYRLLHLGVSARQRHMGDDSTFSYTARALNGRGTAYIDLGLSGESDVSYGAELAAQWDAFGLSAEYGQLEGETAAGVDYEADAFYVDASWSITGEPRAYRGNQGSFGPVVPRAAMGEGGWGHWAVKARYDYIDLSDSTGANRGEQTAYAAGLDWVPVDHVRFMLNYTASEADRVLNPVGSPDADAEVISLRTQFDF